VTPRSPVIGTITFSKTQAHFSLPFPLVALTGHR
jgi:hypothetical protein